MAKKLSLSEQRFGLPPGSIVNLQEQKSIESKITLIKFNESFFNELVCKDMEHALSLTHPDFVCWINVDGLSDLKIFDTLIETKKIDKLVLEDVMEYDTRPKFEEYDDYCFAVAKMLYFDKDTELIFNEQVSFILAGSTLITLQQEFGDVFDKVRDRIRSYGGRIRLRKTDYLLFALLDILTDNYFVVIEKFDEKIQRIEDDLMDNPERSVIPEIRQLKKDIILMRKAAFPLREAVHSMVKADQRIFEKKTISYIKELYEHTVLACENIENSRELTSGLMDIYISMINQKMSNISKVLTIIATIFIPLTFFTGIYGMNFDPLPGAKEPYAFWYAIGFISFVFIGLVIYFRFKKWL